jgi:phage gp45-like
VSRRTAESFRRDQADWWLRVLNLARKITFTATGGALWSALGFDDDEPFDDTPVFQGTGIYSRPGSDDDAEGVLIHIGADPDHGVVVNVRNEDARRRYVEEFGDLNAGEIALFNSNATARIVITSNGLVRIESGNGAGVSLATKADIDDLREWCGAHYHNFPAIGGAPTSTPLEGPPSASGTSVLRGE